jgi:DNA invertase Pin-like site-specific DNA recombinase
MGHLLGYARVSTTDQQPQLQVDALERVGCYRVFTETASGARADRPVLEQVLDQLRPGDTLVVWKLDRLGRSLRHLVDTVTSLADRGVGFRSLQEAIDTTTPGGKLVFHVFAALAEFERDLIRERTAAGLAAARVRGRHGGRPSVMTAHKAQVAREMYRSGQYPVAAIAKTLGVSRASIYRHLTRTDA